MPEGSTQILWKQAPDGTHHVTFDYPPLGKIDLALKEPLTKERYLLLCKIVTLAGVDALRGEMARQAAKGN